MLCVSDSDPVVKNYVPSYDLISLSLDSFHSWVAAKVRGRFSEVAAVKGKEGRKRRLGQSCWQRSVNFSLFFLHH